MGVTVGTERERTAAGGDGAGWMALAGMLNAALAFWWSRGRGPDDATWDITVAWLVGLALVVAAAMVGWSPRRRLRRAAAAIRHPSRWTVVGLGVTALASALRLVALDRFPSVIDSDEGFFLLPARQARVGDLGNPYDTSFFAVPELYRAWQGIVSRPFPDDIASYRLLGALLGAATVFLTWRIGRRLVGEAAGVAAAAVLAALPFHLWVSRVAMNNIVNSFTLALAVLFTLRVMERRQPLDAAVVGLALGFGLYGYYPAAVFPLVIAAWIGAVVVIARALPDVRSTLRLTAWAAVGFFASAAPILGHYVGNPEVFTSRYRTVAGGSAAPGVVDRLADVAGGVLYPFLEQGQGFEGGFYRQGPPFLGWPVAAFAAVGLAVWVGRTVQGSRHRSAPAETPVGLLVVWVVIAGGISQTAGMQSQRFTGIIFVWALAAGTGLVVVVRAVWAGAGWVFPSSGGGPLRVAGLASAVRDPRGPAVLGVVVLLVLGIGHVRSWFSEDRQLSAYGDLRTSAAYDLGWRLRAAGPDPVTVRVEGKPFLRSGGFGNLRFLAPEAQSRLTDHESFPIGPDGRSVAPEIRPGESLVLVVERDDAERCALVARYPDVGVDEARDANGTVLYTAYAVDPEGRLPAGMTPARTQLVTGNARWVGDRRITCD